MCQAWCQHSGPAVIKTTKILPEWSLHSKALGVELGDAAGPPEGLVNPTPTPQFVGRAAVSWEIWAPVASLNLHNNLGGGTSYPRVMVWETRRQVR